jgi:putative hydrolase of HD superfamily
MTDSNLQNIKKFLHLTGILKKISRSGWIEVGVSQPESVADHSFRTAFLCMLYSEMEGLDPLKLLRMALIHDLPEAVIGDLMPSQKTAQTKEEEKKAIHKILSLLPKKLMEKYLEVWNEYEEGKTREAIAVRQLEKIEMALQAKEYMTSGSGKKSLERFIKSAEESTVWPELKRLLSCILEES